MTRVFLLNLLREEYPDIQSKHNAPLSSSNHHLRHSSQRQQEETWYSDPLTHASWDFVSYCYGMGQRHPGEPADNIIQAQRLDYLKIRNQTSNRSAHFFRTIWALSHTQCNEAPEATQTLESNFFTHLSFSRPRTRCVHCWRVAILKPTETCSKVNDAIFNFFFIK